MAKKNDPADDYEANLNELKNKLKQKSNSDLGPFSRQGLKPTKSLPSIDQLIAEGEAIIAKEEKEKEQAACSKKTESKVSSPKSNLNLLQQARENVFKLLPDWRKKEFLSMEAAGGEDTNKEHFMTIVKLIVEEFDKLTP